MKYKFCPSGESLAVIFDSHSGGFSSCAAGIVFPVFMLILAIIRMLIVKPNLCKRNKPAETSETAENNSDASEPLPGGRRGRDGVRHRIRLRPGRRQSQAREPKSKLMKQVFFWLHVLTPLHYVLLLLIRMSVEKLAFAWIWPLSLVVIKLSWSMATVCLETESARALDQTKPRRFHHDPVLFIFWVSAIVYEMIPVVNSVFGDWPYPLTSKNDKIEFALWVVRLYHCVVLLLIGIFAPGLPRRRRGHRVQQGDEEGLVSEDPSRMTSEDESTFSNLLAKFKFLWPYIWPKDEPLTQLYVVFCFVILVLGRVANVFIPIFYSKVVAALSDKDLSKIPYSYLFAYSCFYLMTGSGLAGAGLLSNIRSFLWINVTQYTSRRTMVDIFSHLHSLSLRWHLARKTGEVLGVIDRGNNSVSVLLNYILFTIIPCFADIFIAIGYFIIAFNLYFGLIVFGCIAAYIAATVAISEWRTKFRREVNKLDNATRTRAVDSLINFETVKYYGAEDFEIDRYRKSLISYQWEQWKNQASIQLLNLVQVLIVNMGLLSGCILCAYYIVELDKDVGTFVLYTTYIVQLYGPLNSLGMWYRMIQQSFIDMENMLDLFTEQPDVNDADNCPDLILKGGEIVFDNVCFQYRPEKQILKNVSFRVPPGSTVAVVGPSGSGKSTLIRLLFRFYDVNSGAILIDGEDISKVSQASLRRNIGVVPQDTVLFNDTIKYNIQYGRPTAGEEEVFEAARRADIHHRIEAFPDQYATKVGERGLKLSGGEKQRVAIARTVLKAPKMILLDEATSALDTQTERNIQSALDDVSKDRTTLVVAHRLSTVVNADLILVLKEGTIVERGTHQQLLGTPDSLYASMWNQQATVMSENQLNTTIIDEVHEE